MDHKKFLPAACRAQLVYVRKNNDLKEVLNR